MRLTRDEDDRSLHFAGRDVLPSVRLDVLRDVIGEDVALNHLDQVVECVLTRQILIVTVVLEVRVVWLL